MMIKVKLLNIKIINKLNETNLFNYICRKIVKKNL